MVTEADHKERILCSKGDEIQSFSNKPTGLDPLIGRNVGQFSIGLKEIVEHKNIICVRFEVSGGDAEEKVVLIKRELVLNSTNDQTIGKRDDVVPPHEDLPELSISNSADSGVDCQVNVPLWHVHGAGFLRADCDHLLTAADWVGEIEGKDVDSCWFDVLKVGVPEYGGEIYLESPSANIVPGNELVWASELVVGYQVHEAVAEFSAVEVLACYFELPDPERVRSIRDVQDFDEGVVHWVRVIVPFGTKNSDVVPFEKQGRGIEVFEPHFGHDSGSVGGISQDDWEDLVGNSVDVGSVSFEQISLVHIVNLVICAWELIRRIYWR